MTKSVFGCVYTVVALSLLGVVGCYAKVEVSDSSAEKAIAIDWVEPPCAEPGSAAGYIEGNGFGAENVTITVGGIEAEVLTATGMDASFVVPEELPPGPTEVVVTNPGGRIATINWVVCGFDCSAIDCDDGNECTTDSCDPAVEECVHTPVGDGEACDFGGLPGVCIAGLCEEDLCENVDCDDGDPCTSDSCDPLTGSCSNVGVCEDVDPPELTDFDFDPKQIDVSSQSQDVTCTMALTDSGVGANQAVCQFASPSKAQTRQCAATAPSSGDAFDGIWSCTVTIEPGVEAGIWTVSQIVPIDLLGNRQFIQTAELDARGFPTQLEVTSPSADVDPPELTDFDFDPKQIDVSSQSQDVTCTMALTDSGVGANQAVCQFASPSKAQTRQCAATAPSSGDAFDGFWSCTVTIEPGVEAGIWTVSQIVPIDLLGNRQFIQTAELDARGFPTQLEVTSPSADVDPPELTDFDFDPKQIDVSSQSQDVTCTMALTDSGVGANQAVCQFASPSKAQTRQCAATAPSSGDAFDGIRSCTVTIEPGVEAGIWTVSQIVPIDLLGNRQFIQTAELDARGFPTQLEVTYGGPGGDVDPPVITDFDFNPKSVDVTTGPQDVTCSFTATDSGVGVGSLACVFENPSGTLWRSCIATSPSADGTWSCVATILQGEEAGTWPVRVTANDAIGNSIQLFTADLQALGFPTQLQVASTSDVDPPVITDFDFTPKSVDVTTGPQDVTCSFTATDSGVGVGSLACVFENPSGTLWRSCIATSPSADGTWSCVATILQGEEAGTWPVRVTANDAIGNSIQLFTADLQALGFPTQLQVASTSDVDPPVITDFDFTPKSVDVTTGPQDVICSFTATDSGVGVGSLACVFENPSGTLWRSCIATSPSADGTWSCVATILQGEEAGTWPVRVTANDAIGNSIQLFTADLQALGFPTQLDVTYGSGSPP